MFKKGKNKPEPFRSLKTSYCIECITTSTVRQEIIIGTSCGYICTYDLATFEPKRQIEISGFPTGDLARQRIYGILRQRGNISAAEEVNNMKYGDDFPLGEALKKYEIGVDEVGSHGAVKCVCTIGERLAIAFNSTVGVLDIETAGDVVVVEERSDGHNGIVRYITSVGGKLLSLANDRIICLWELTGKLLTTIPRVDEDDYYTTSLLVGNDLLISGSRESTFMNERAEPVQVFEISIFSLPSDEKQAKFIKYLHHNRTSPHHDVIGSICRLSDGRILTGSQDGVFALWDEFDYHCLFIKINALQLEYSKLKLHCPVHSAVLCDGFFIISNERLFEILLMIKPLIHLEDIKEISLNYYLLKKLIKKFQLLLIIGETGEIHTLDVDITSKPNISRTQLISVQGKILTSCSTNKEVLFGCSSGDVISIMSTYENDRAILSINSRKCIGCKVCVKVCPFSVLAIEDSVCVAPNMVSCVGCGTCERNCPMGAITVEKKKK
ncbi:Uncharacterized protein QTN25_006957 [Entamoeba marina]